MKTICVLISVCILYFNHDALSQRGFRSKYVVSSRSNWSKSFYTPNKLPTRGFGKKSAGSTPFTGYPKWVFYPDGKGVGKTFSDSKKKITKLKTYQVYMKKNGYIGRTSGQDGAMVNIRRRNSTHHKNEVLSSKHKMLLSSTNKDAIRGAEDILIRRQKAKGKLANGLKGISDKNPKLQHYWDEAFKEFGIKLF